MTNFSLNLKSKEEIYNIYIEDYSLDGFKSKILEVIHGKKVLVVISDKVNKLYGKKIFPLAGDGEFIVYKYILPDGEKQKNFKNYRRILNFALKNGLTRKDCVLAIGGGVVGDLAGFVAATYMRGIDLIQVPTTLLACVDSSVGGKTAIDTDYGKNLVGAFYQPKSVIIDVNFMRSLDEKQFKTGLGEVVKYAFIEKSCRCLEYENLINYLNENFEKLMQRDMKVLKRIVEICVALKISVVEKDEKESNLRRILNFGHTLGHAIEKSTGYKKYTHGEAIVQGMIFAFELAYKIGLIDVNYKFAATDLISKFKFRPVKMPKMKKLIELMKLDKKATSESIVFVLPKDYGQVEIREFRAQELLSEKDSRPAEPEP